LETLPHRILHLMLRPILYVMLRVLLVIDDAAYWLDKHIKTELRKPRTTPEEVERLIESYLSSGSSSSDISNFVKSNGFSYSEQFYDDYWQRSTSEQSYKLIGKENHIKSYTVAWIKNIGKDLLFVHDIRIIFYLDEQNRLVEYVIERIITVL
jgi:hypothetical protein